MKKIKDLFYKNRSLFLVIFVIGCIYFIINQKVIKNKEYTIPNPSFNKFSEELGTSVINCEFKVFSKFSFNIYSEKEKLIKYGTNNQDESVNIIFSGLDTETPVMKGNNGEDPILILPGTENEINLATFNSFGDMFVYKIYKKEKVATWYKSYNMLGSPYTVVTMGYCY